MISLIDNGKISDDVKEAPGMSFDDRFGIPVKNGPVNPSSKDIPLLHVGPFLFVLFFVVSRRPLWACTTESGAGFSIVCLSVCVTWYRGSRIYFGSGFPEFASLFCLTVDYDFEFDFHVDYDFDFVFFDFDFDLDVNFDFVL